MRRFVSIVFAMLIPAIAAASVVINSTNVAGSELTISGTGFSGTPLSVTFNGVAISIVSSSSTQIVAALNTVPAPGSYRVGVKAGKAAASAYAAVDRAGIAVVNSSSSPIFDASLGSTLKITLLEQATSSTLINAVPGQHLTLIICAEGGNFGVVLPSTFRTASDTSIGAEANKCSVADFVVDADGQTVFESSAVQTSE